MSDNQTTIELSKRELQVLEMVATGASNQEIAYRLVISVNTVKVHVRNIFEKLGVQSRTEATLRAIQEGLVAVTESDGSPSDDAEPAAPLTRTFLINPNPPMVLPRWQQIYLLLATLLALTMVILPLLPRETRRIAPDLPVIYAQRPTPVPLTQPNGASSRWVTLASMPSSRAGLALSSLGNQIFAIGGVRDNNKATRSVEIYDTETNSWVEGATKPTAAANISSVTIDDKIYVPGGCTNDGNATEVLEIYHPKIDQWTQGPPLPAPRCGYALVAVQDKLYLFGGWNGRTFEDSIFTFSPGDDRWETLAVKMPHALGYAGAAVLDDAIYLAGGYDGQDEFNQTYAFLPATGKWLEKSPLNEKRGGLGLISGGKNLFAIGGGWNHNLDTSEKYNPDTDTWTTFETPFTSQWRNLGLTTRDTTLYAVGGWDGSDEQYMNSVVSYQFLYQFFIPISSFNN